MPVEVKNLREEKKDQVKTEKVYKKGTGITEKVLFDDGFDWESFDEKAEAKATPNEKLAELDLMEVDDDELISGSEPLFEEPENGLDSFGLFRDSDLPTEQASQQISKRPPKFKTRNWVAAGALFVILPLVFVVTWTRITSSKLDRNVVRADQVTREIHKSVQEFLPMKPFMVPISKNDVKTFQWVSPTLVVQSYGSYLIKEQIEAIRGEIFNALKTPEQRRGPLNGDKLAILIQGRINGYLGMNLVEKVRIVIRDPIITNFKTTGLSDYS